MSQEPTTALAAADLQRALWAEYIRTRDPRVREKIELMYIDLVRALAEQLARKLPDCVEASDLAQEGFIGLRRAVERFDPSRAIKFTTYAQTLISGAMFDSLRRGDFGTRGARRKAQILQQVRNRFACECGRPPTDHEMAAVLGIAIEDFADLAKAAKVGAMVTLSPRDEHDGGQIPADRRTPDPALQAHREDLRQTLLRGYDPSERLIIMLYYFEEMTMAEVGATLGISESRVSQKHANLVERIKADLERRKSEWQ